MSEDESRRNRLSIFIAKASAFLRKLWFLMPTETRRRWLGLLVLAIFVSALEAVAAVVVVALLSFFASAQGPSTLPLLGDFSPLSAPPGDGVGPWVAAALGAFFLLRGLIYLTQSYLQNRLAYRTSALLARRLLRGYLAMPYQDYARRNSAEMIRNAHESTIGLAAHVLFPGIVLVAEVFVTVTLATLLMIVAPAVALVAFAILGLLVIVLLRFVQPRLLVLGRSLQIYSTESLKWLQQSLHGLRDIRISGSERFFVDRFEQIRLHLAKGYGGHGVLVDVPRLSLETGVLSILIALFLLQSGGSPSRTQNLSVLALFGYAAFRMLPSVNRIVNSLQALRFSTTLVDLLYLDVVAAEDFLGDESLEEGDRFRFADSIELREVTYRYPDSDRDALSSVSLVIHRGESLGVIGRTGSGKSTLLDLILGLLVPTRGEILVDGQPLNTRTRAWQSNIGLVPQTIFLLDDTVRNNIALGVPPENVDEEAVASAVRVARLDDVVAKLPAGLDTVVGERGVKLSGGQRQRLAIARALYRGPKVLVLDEGLSALDSQTEAELIAELAAGRGDMTIISVAHRASTIRNCDRVLALAEGRVVAQGPLDELIDTNEDVAALMREAPGAA